MVQPLGSQAPGPDYGTFKTVSSQAAVNKTAEKTAAVAKASLSILAKTPDPTTPAQLSGVMAVNPAAARASVVSKTAKEIDQLIDRMIAALDSLWVSDSRKNELEATMHHILRLIPPENPEYSRIQGRFMELSQRAAWRGIAFFVEPTENNIAKMIPIVESLLDSGSLSEERKDKVAAQIQSIGEVGCFKSSLPRPSQGESSPKGGVAQSRLQADYTRLEYKARNRKITPYTSIK